MKSIFTNFKGLTLFLILVTSFSYAQGPWASGKGHGYSQLLFNVIPTYNEVFDKSNPEGIRQAQRELSDITIAPYVEFGVSERLTLGGSIPFIIVSTGEATDSNITPLYPEDNLASLGNISMFGKYTIIDKKWKLAVIADLGLRTSSRNEVSGLSTGVDAFTLQPKLSLGSSSGKFYYYGVFGYGSRNNGYHDFLSFGVEGGYKVTEKITLILGLNSLSSLDNGSDSVNSPANIETGFYTSDQEYNAFTIKVFAEKLYKNLGGFFSLGGGGVEANSVAASPAISLGMFYKW